MENNWNTTTVRHMELCAVALCVAAALGSCSVEEALTDGAARVGEEVRFGASASYDKDAAETKTSYSGIVNDGKERIDWSAGDNVTIFSPEASMRGATEKHSASYGVTPYGTEGKGNLLPLQKNGLVWADGANRFRAVYPALIGANTNVKDYVKNGRLDEDGVFYVMANQPAVQTPATSMAEGFQENATGMMTLAPDMGYATLVAGTKVSSPGEKVNLNFKPAYTAFQFTLYGGEEGFVLKSFRLYSDEDGEPLSGWGTVLVNDNVDERGYIQDGASAGYEIALGGIPEGGIQIPSGKSLRFTLLAHYRGYSKLLVAEAVRDGSDKPSTLKLTKKEADGSVAPYFFQPGKKYNINLGNVPADMPNTYFIEVEAPSVVPATSNLSGSFKVASYMAYVDKEGKLKEGTQQDAPWKVAGYSLDEGVTWKTDKPAWLVSMVEGGEGSVTKRQFGLTLAGNPASSATSTKAFGNKTVIASSKSSAYDLSTHDIHGNACARTTANCYIVSQPGWYKFPKVYGNAIKNGAVNTSAFTSSGGDSKVLKTFVIPGSTGGSSQVAFNPSNVNGCYLPSTCSNTFVGWMDVEGLVQDASCDDEYVYFQVPENSIAQGNAVIYAGKGSQIWTWHIWVMERERLVVHEVPDRKDSGRKYGILDLNLGWYDSGTPSSARSLLVKLVSASVGSGMQPAERVFRVSQMGDAAFGGNVYYQWGRKDPLLGYTEKYVGRLASSATAWTITDRDTYDTDPSQTNSFGWTIGSHIYPSGATGDYGDPNLFNLAYAMRHPDHMFIERQNVYDVRWWNGWTYEEYINLWNSLATYQGYEGKVGKTIYDPCPPGFTVAPVRAFSYFATEELGYVQRAASCLNVVSPESSYGYFFKTSDDDARGIFFPATNMREWRNSTVRGYNPSSGAASLTGYYWTSGVHTQRADGVTDRIPCVALSFDCVGGTVLPMSTGCAPHYGFSVRPVREE